MEQSIQPETLQAVIFKLLLLGARVWSAGSSFLQLCHSSIIEGRSPNEGRSASSSSVTVNLDILLFLRVSQPLGSPLIVQQAAECGVGGGHINVISTRQMTALREAVTFAAAPVANYLRSVRTPSYHAVYQTTKLGSHFA